LSLHVAELVSRLESPHRWHRRRNRTSIPFLMELTPLDSPGGLRGESAQVVVGKDISEQGIGFFHQGAIPHRRVRLRLETAELGPLELDVEILWCHFTRQGWYESGGRIIGCSSSLVA
jgi:hypothetical protein